jgi:hypothetical protein
MRSKCFLNEDVQVLWTEELLGVDAVAGDPTLRDARVAHQGTLSSAAVLGTKNQLWSTSCAQHWCC